MIIKSLALALTAAVSTEVAVSAHELFSDAKDPAIAALGESMMPLDEKNELSKAATAAPDQLATHLRAAVARNPYDSAARIELSVAAENSGNMAEARTELAAATEHDATAAPLWAKANFYFRQGDQKQFVAAVNSYRAVTHNEEAGLFRMAAEEAPDVHTLLVNMPDLGCDELGNLLDTVRERDLSPDELIDRMSSSCHDDASGKVLAHYMSDLLRTDKVDLATQVRHRIGETDPLVNAYFTSPVTGEGFDWRVNVNNSIQVHQEARQGIQFDFEDRVPSGTVLIFQPIALPPDGRYRLSTNLESEPHEDDAFRWELVELSTGRHLASGLDEDNINKIPSWDFTIPKTGKTLALALFYKRAEGELPFQGTVTVQGVVIARGLQVAALTQGKR